MEEEQRNEKITKKNNGILKVFFNVVKILLIVVLELAFVYAYDNIDTDVLTSKQKQRTPLTYSEKLNNNIYTEDDMLKKGVINEGILLDEVDISGMTYEDAVNTYKDYVKYIEDRKIIFNDSLGSYSVNFSKLDINSDYENAVKEALLYGRKGNLLIRYKDVQLLNEDNKVEIIPEKKIDEQKLKVLLKNETEHMERTPVNSNFVRKGEDFVITPSENGVMIDVDKTTALVNEKLHEKWEKNNIQITAVTEDIEPEYTEEYFNGIDSMLGQATTQYNTINIERIANLTVGAQKISNKLIYPGEQFSVYEAVAPFTEENGYKNAGQYINAELVDGLGGGICQIATTLYDAVLRAELQVDERYPHSMTVSYVDKGMDAAIAEGYEDFKFTNNTDKPIYIDASAEGGFISVAIYGHDTRSKGRHIEFESLVLQTFPPGGEKVIYDDTIPYGTTKVTDAHTGYYVELWKHIYEGDELVDSVKVNGSQYSAVSKTTRIGTLRE